MKSSDLQFGRQVSTTRLQPPNCSKSTLIEDDLSIALNHIDTTHCISDRNECADRTRQAHPTSIDRAFGDAVASILVDIPSFESAISSALARISNPLASLPKAVSKIEPHAYSGGSDSPEPLDSLAAFQARMENPASSALRPSQKADLFAPVTDYFVSSSHSASLTGNKWSRAGAGNAYTDMSSHPAFGRNGRLHGFHDWTTRILVTRRQLAERTRLPNFEHGWLTTISRSFRAAADLARLIFGMGNWTLKALAMATRVAASQILSRRNLLAARRGKRKSARATRLSTLLHPGGVAFWPVIADIVVSPEAASKSPRAWNPNFFMVTRSLQEPNFEMSVRQSGAAPVLQTSCP